MSTLPGRTPHRGYGGATLADGDVVRLVDASHVGRQVTLCEGLIGVVTPNGVRLLDTHNPASQYLWMTSRFEPLEPTP